MHANCRAVVFYRSCGGLMFDKTNKVLFVVVCIRSPNIALNMYLLGRIIESTNGKFA